MALLKKEISRSSEEQYIEIFLHENRIKFDSEVEIKGLRHDNKSFRRADFLLPRLGIYIEYYGLYNSTKKNRQEYDLKTQVYLKNSIPTVFIYPHELGIIEYAFHVKILRVLKHSKFRKRGKLFRYKLNRLFNQYWERKLGIGFVVFICFLTLNQIDVEINGEMSENSSPIGFLTSFLAVYFLAGFISMFSDAWDIFKREY